MRFALAIFFLCSLSVTVRADPGAVQTVLSDGDTYVLRENGSITKNNQVIDNGTGTKAIAVCRRNLYVLKNSGELWCQDDYSGTWMCIDKESHSTWIAANDKHLIILKSYGNVEIGTGGTQIYAGGDATDIWVENGILFLSTETAIKKCDDALKGHWVVAEKRAVEKRRNLFLKLSGQ
jgi:hypothetical protein